MSTTIWFFLALILCLSSFVTGVLMQKRHLIVLRATVRMVAKLILSIPVALIVVITFGLFVFTIGEHYLGSQRALPMMQDRVQQLIEQTALDELLLTLLQDNQGDVTDIGGTIGTDATASVQVEQTPTVTPTTTPRLAIADASQIATTTITPAAIFATATAARMATQAALVPLARETTVPPTRAATVTSLPLTPLPLTSLPLTSLPTASLPAQTLVLTATIIPAATSVPETQPLPPTAQAIATNTGATRAPLVDIADIPVLTATAMNQAVQATVDAILTRVDNPDFTVEAFTPTSTPVVITATPTPGDIFAAATAAAVRTGQAITIGTATPTPENWKVVTPIYVVNTATPANAATAAYLAALATAEVVTTGTPDPYRHVVVKELITATPTATSLVAEAMTYAAATVQSTAFGTPTPTPEEWLVITPVVVTATATPANRLTASAQAAIAAAQALLTSTPPWYELVVTATPTPPSVLVESPVDLLTLSHGSPFYEFPSQLLGKILFRSDVSGEEEIYSIRPDGSELSLLPDDRAYRLAEARDAFSKNGLSRAYAKRDSHNRLIQIHYESFEYVTTRAWSAFGSGVAWAPAWSPTAERIAFVSNDSGNDEIWLMDKDQWPAIQITRNSWEWDKHPSWSPDGSAIVFASNRIGGSRQLWLMDADGGNPRQLTKFDLPLDELGHVFSNLVFEAWDPVWVKYPDPYIRMSRESYLARPECVVCLPVD